MNSIVDSIKELKERLSWDEYFMSAAYLVSQRSPCERLHVGCVLVKDNRIIACGYNGFIAGAPHVGHVRDGHEQMTIHAETNAIADCSKRGVISNECTAYVTHFCCINCTKILIASGINKIVYAEDYKNDDLVYKLCENGNVGIFRFNISRD